MGSKRRKKGQRGANAAAKDKEPRMSAVILELAEPLLKKYGDTPRRSQSIIALTIAAWNKAVLPAEMREGFERKVLDAVVPPGKIAEGTEVIADITKLIAERRRKHYPNLQKYIVDFDLDVSEGKISLNVASATLPAGKM